MKLDTLGRRNNGWAKPGPGSNGVNEGLIQYISFFTTKEMNQELSNMARKQKISKSELIRQYCTWGLENDKV